MQWWLGRNWSVDWLAALWKGRRTGFAMESKKESKKWGGRLGWSWMEKRLVDGRKELR